MNLYAYVGNNPVNYTDPSWLKSKGFISKSLDNIASWLEYIGAIEYTFIDNESYWLLDKVFWIQCNSDTCALWQKDWNKLTMLFDMTLISAWTEMTTVWGTTSFFGWASCLVTNWWGCAVWTAWEVITAWWIATIWVWSANLTYMLSKSSWWTNSTPSNNSDEYIRLKKWQWYKDKEWNIWKKDMKHKDHWDISNNKWKKIKEIDFEWNQIWPNWPKNKNKTF